MCFSSGMGQSTLDRAPPAPPVPAAAPLTNVQPRLRAESLSDAGASREPAAQTERRTAQNCSSASGLLISYAPLRRATVSQSDRFIRQRSAVAIAVKAAEHGSRRPRHRAFLRAAELSLGARIGHAPGVTKLRDLWTLRVDNAIAPPVHYRREWRPDHSLSCGTVWCRTLQRTDAAAALHISSRASRGMGTRPLPCSAAVSRPPTFDRALCDSVGLSAWNLQRLSSA